MRKRFFHFRLVPNWRRIHRTTTVMLSMMLVILSAAQGNLALFQSFLTAQQFAIVSMVMGVAIAFFRYLEQPSLHQDTPGEEKS